MTGIATRRLCFHVMLALGLIDVANAEVLQDSGDMQRIGSCGIESLRMAMVMLHHEKEVDRVEEVLPEQSSHTMEELAVAGRSLGLKVIAVQFDGIGTIPVDVPMIVCVGRGKVKPKHFVVLVCHASGNASVIDLPRPVGVIETSKLLDAGVWDGSALLLSDDSAVIEAIRANENSQAMAWLKGLGIVFALVGSVLGVLAWRRGRRD